jgi:hypothetical protein
LFWTCLNEEHKRVTWTGDVAACDTCGLTSEMTARFARGVQAYERERIVTLARECGAGYTSDRDLIRERRPFADHPGLSGDAS